MHTKFILFNRRSFCSLVVTMFVLALAAMPILARVGQEAPQEKPALYQGGVSTDQMTILSRGTVCVCQHSGVLGREGGALALLGVGQPNTRGQRAVGAAGYTFTLGAVHNGHTATWTSYTRNEVLGRDGGALALLQSTKD